MTGARRHAAAAVLLAAVVAAGAGVVALAQPAAAVAVPFELSMPAMLPGESRTVTQQIQVPQDARVVATEWTASGHPAQWDVALCDVVCTPLGQRPGTVLTARTIDVRITVRMPDDLPQGASARGEGSITLTAADGTLPSTGAALSPIVTVGVAVVLASGLILVLAARRREKERER